MANSKAIALFVAAASLCGCALALEPHFFRPLATFDATAIDGSASDGSIVVRDSEVSSDGSRDGDLIDRVEPELPDASVRSDAIDPSADSAFSDASPLDVLVDSGVLLDVRADASVDAQRDSGVDVRGDSGSATDAGRADVPSDSTGSSGCAAGQLSCGGRCTDVNNDPNNCGSCGMLCGAIGSYCHRGMCASCPFPMIVCPAVGGGSCCGNACVAGGGCSASVGEDAF